VRFDLHVHLHADPEVLKGLNQLLRIIKPMADKLDTVLERVTAQETVIDGIAEIVATWTDDRAALREQIVALQAQLGEAGNDTEQVDALLADFDRTDAKLAGIKDKLAPAVVENTPVEE
jgi:uncharacterized coiled-coil protein SlyX